MEQPKGGQWFKILTPKTPPTGDYVYFALTAENYERLSRILAENQRWIKEAVWRFKLIQENAE